MEPEAVLSWAMKSEDSAFMGRIVDGVQEGLSMIPDANTVALSPADFERIQTALASENPQILVGEKILGVVEDLSVKPGNVSLQAR